MSTAKFNISDMGTGNDTHSNFLIRNGYGNLLNRPGRQEITIDTASMYKKAADQGSFLGAGVGGVAGGIGGAEIAEAMGGSATAKLMGALVGAGLGGVGGYYLGKELDKQDKNNLTAIDKYRDPVYTVGGGALGALTGYGLSKYLMGSKNKTHHVISALLGAGVGAGAGHLVSGGEEYNEAFKDGLLAADRAGVKDRNQFAKLYAKHRTKDKINPWYNLLAIDTDEGLLSNMFMKQEEDAFDSAVKEYNGEKKPREFSTIKAIASGAGTTGLGYGAYKGLRAIRNGLRAGGSRRRYEIAATGLHNPGNRAVLRAYGGIRPSDLALIADIEASGATISERTLRKLQSIPEIASMSPADFRKAYPNIASQLDNKLMRQAGKKVFRTSLKTVGDLFRALF